MRVSGFGVPVVGAALLAGVGACGDVTGPEPQGTLVVGVATSGPDADGDGYSVTLDDAAHLTVSSNGRVVFPTVGPGDHRVGLGGIADNCALTGENPRSITVPAGDTVRLSLALTCTAVTATVVLSTVTSGLVPDPNGYLVMVDGGTAQPVATSGSIILHALAPGQHRFELADLSPACTVQGENPVTATLQAGRTATLTFLVQCQTAPLGSLLFTGTAGETTHVFYLSPDGSVEDLTPDADGNNARWSPDGRRIAFGSDRSGVSGVYVMNADGTHVIRLIENNEVTPDWSPDGTSLLVWPFEAAGFGEITIIDAATGAVRGVVGRGSLPVWSPDGSRIAFESITYDACIFDLCAIDVFTMAADGTDIRRLTTTADPIGYAVAPQWSPDGTQIAYLAGDLLHAPVIRIMTADGVQLRALGVVGSHPVWSPDGSRIAATSAQPGPDVPILIFPAAGGHPIAVSPRPGTNVPTDWR